MQKIKLGIIGIGNMGSGSANNIKQSVISSDPVDARGVIF